MTWTNPYLRMTSRHISEQTSPYATALSAAAVDMKAMANDERGFLMSGDADFRDEINERAVTIRAELKQAKAASSADDGAAVDAVSSKFELWTKALDGEFALYGRDRTAAIELALGKNRDLRKA
jgi:methyl-accepting chemotaxis protein